MSSEFPRLRGSPYAIHLLKKSPKQVRSPKYEAVGSQGSQVFGVRDPEEVSKLNSSKSLGNQGVEEFTQSGRNSAALNRTLNRESSDSESWNSNRAIPSLRLL